MLTILDYGGTAVSQLAVALFALFIAATLLYTSTTIVATAFFKVKMRFEQRATTAMKDTNDGL